MIKLLRVLGPFFFFAPQVAEFIQKLKDKKRKKDTKMADAKVVDLTGDDSDDDGGGKRKPEGGQAEESLSFLPNLTKGRLYQVLTSCRSLQYNESTSLHDLWWGGFCHCVLKACAALM